MDTPKDKRTNGWGVEPYPLRKEKAARPARKNQKSMNNAPLYNPQEGVEDLTHY